MKILRADTRELRQRGLGAAQAALWAVLLGALVWLLLACCLTGLLGSLPPTAAAAQAQARTRTPTVRPTGRPTIRPTIRPTPRPTIRPTPRPGPRAVIIRDTPLPTGLSAEATYFIDGGPKPRLIQGRITYLACATVACTRYVVTVSGRCRVFAVGATLVYDQPCTFLPLAHTRAVRR